MDKNRKNLKFIKRNKKGKGKNAGVENWIPLLRAFLGSSNWLDILATSSDLSSQGLFDYPKNVQLIQELVSVATSKNDITIDFFSGSATSAHAVMLSNVKDKR